ncbi:nucleotidyltransferase family protein [Halobacillus salinus]|uniref:nucleotidyltransferase family protein n=1 Tax=Halobacillus salinus TaxID=192814 RepID=UPI0020CA7EBC|nr:nucleotidyltransferase family protein [Halobacillus salinus]
MMDQLEAVKTLDLPDWWISAGFVRSKIWDVMHGFRKRTPLPDIDVIYFDSGDIRESEEKKLEAKLRSLVPETPWSVKNQARMHVISDMPPYFSSIDGIAHFPETVTALGVKLNEKDELELAAPWGVEDVIRLEVRPTPVYDSEERIGVYKNRIGKKNWVEKWDGVKVFGHDGEFIDPSN